MIHCYIKDEFPDEYVPTVFDAYKGHMNFESREVLLNVWDTAGQDDLQKLRPLAYPNANCFLVCFSLVDRGTLKNACSQWRDELLASGPVNCPKILIGLKSDLREEWLKDPQRSAMCISKEEGMKAKDDFAF